MEPLRSTLARLLLPDEITAGFVKWDLSLHTKTRALTVVRDEVSRKSRLSGYGKCRQFREAAIAFAEEDPDGLSFLHSVRVVRRRMARFGAIPPTAEKNAL